MENGLSVRTSMYEKERSCKNPKGSSFEEVFSGFPRRISVRRRDPGLGPELDKFVVFSLLFQAHYHTHESQRELREISIKFNLKA